MSKIYYRAIPYIKKDVLLALECGVDGLIVEDTHFEQAIKLARVEVFKDNNFSLMSMQSKQDEEIIATGTLTGKKFIIAHGWEINWRALPILCWKYKTLPRQN